MLKIFQALIIIISIIEFTFAQFDCQTYYADIDGDGDGAKSTFCARTELSSNINTYWDDDGWETNGCTLAGWNDGPSGHLSYGPYISSDPGPTNVTWNLLVNGDTNNDGTQIASIDINDVTTNQVVAWHNINVNDFNASMTWQDFTLSYYSTADHVYEFRTWYTSEGGHLVLRYITHINEDANTGGAYATTELCDGDDTSSWSLNTNDYFPTCAVDNYSNIDWAGDQDSDGYYGFDGPNLYINIESYPNIGTATLTANGTDHTMDYADWGANAHWSYQLPTTASTSYDWSVIVSTCGGTSQTVSGTFTTDCSNAFNGSAVVDECGVCDGDGSSCACSGGDVNGDGLLNVLDIVAIVSYVVDGEADFDTACADLNGDGLLNILDVVSLVNDIVNGRVNIVDAASAKLIKSGSGLSLQADGYIGGIQMTLSHGFDFNIKLTDNVWISDYSTHENRTTLVLVEPDDGRLFTASDSFEIVDMIVANSHSAIRTMIVEDFDLSDAYPNPFNPSTTVKLSLPESGMVSVMVYNLNGQLMDVLENRHMPVGQYQFTWNASYAPSGIYLLHTEYAGMVSTQKVMLLK